MTKFFIFSLSPNYVQLSSMRPDDFIYLFIYYFKILVMWCSTSSAGVRSQQLEQEIVGTSLK